MPYYSLRQVPPEEQSQWLDDLFGVEHKDYGFTAPRTGKINFQKLTAALHCLSRGEISSKKLAKLGLAVETHQLKIAESARKRLYGTLQLTVQPPVRELTHRQKSDIVDAEEFVRAWILTKAFLLAEGERVDRLREMEPPARLREP